MPAALLLMIAAKQSGSCPSHTAEASLSWDGFCRRTVFS
ncbi:hypothetical protein AtDm6_0785 [Acetobacter tropicalis]|uniref:Uncharacterized protein n=1 Tax=Acetobacter tropicalis TaxID=104102 RepID=A0A094YWR6_9PROT|nr:hypothetical protein AtDm6_0785 [Acetobacter tropicalis]